MSADHVHRWKRIQGGALHCLDWNNGCTEMVMGEDTANSLQAIAQAAREMDMVLDHVHPIHQERIRPYREALTTALAALDVRNAAAVGMGEGV